MAITLDGSNGISSPDFEPSSSTTPTNGLFLPTTNAIGFATNSTERLRLDASGNLGLGVTPSGWSIPVVQSNYGTYAGNAQAQLSANYYYASADKYIGNGYATLYAQQSGIHKWYTAANNSSGAGAAISFTQAMTLDASGRLLVGTTSAAGSSPLQVNGSIYMAGGNGTGLTWDSTISSQYIKYSSALDGLIMNGYAGLAFYTLGSERARIDSSGNLLIGDTAANGRIYAKSATADGTTNAFYGANSSGTLLFQVYSNGYFKTGTAASSPYNNTTATAANVNVDSSGLLYRSTSSARYKNSITNAVHGLAEVLKLRPVTYKGNNDGDTVFGGLIAEEVHDAGLTEFVQYNDDGEPDALAYGNMVSLAFKAIQELTARLEALENK